MNLYILRHAIALERSEWHKADADRPLTKEGEKKMRKAAKGMRAIKLRFDWILTSPYRRAYDTAVIVAKELRAVKTMRITKSLASDGDPQNLVRHLARDFRSWESVLLVGHEPYLGRLISVLISGNAGSGLQLKKGGLAYLTADSLTYGQCAKLEWLLQPKALKRQKQRTS